MILIICMQFIIVLCLVAAARRSLENALPVFCFFLVLMPLEARLVIPGLFDFNTMRVSLLTLLALYLYHGRANSDDTPLPLKSLILLHVGWVVCSTLYSLSVATSVKQLISQVVEYYLLYFLFVKIITRTSTIYNIIFAIVIAMGICSIFSVVEVYARWSILRIFPQNLWITYNGGVDPLYIEWGRGLRVRSTFPHPILFGDALAMTIPLTLYLLSIWERRRDRILLWASLMLMFWAIYKTSSRGPWIATALCGILLFIMVRNRIRTYLLVIALMAIAVLLARPGVWATIAGLYESSTDASSPVGSSYLYRDALNNAVRTAVGKDPGRAALGYGLGTFRELGLDINFLNTVQRWYTCDNNWALFLYETGYVGLFLTAALLFAALWIAFRTYWQLPPPESYFGAAIFTSLSGFYFLLLSVAGYSWGQQGYMAWILISISVSYSRIALLNDNGQVEDEVAEDPEEYYELHIA
jgi:hypothetical protein